MLLAWLWAAPSAAQERGPAVTVGFGTEIAVMEGEGAEPYLDARLPAARLRVGLFAGPVFVEADLSLRHRSRLPGGSFGSLDALVSGMWYYQGPTTPGVYIGAGAGFSARYLEAGDERWLDVQPALGAHAGYLAALAESVLLRAGVFSRLFPAAGELARRSESGAELGLAVSWP